jgi:hypothetical protein
MVKHIFSIFLVLVAAASFFSEKSPASNPSDQEKTKAFMVVEC